MSQLALEGSACYGQGLAPPAAVSLDPDGYAEGRFRLSRLLQVSGEAQVPRCVLQVILMRVVFGETALESGRSREMMSRSRCFLTRTC